MNITSFQNPKIKQTLRLQQKSRERKKQGLFVVEGVQENRLALENRFIPEYFIVSDEVFLNELNLNEYHCYYVPVQLYEKIAYRKGTGGVIGIYRSKTFDLEDLNIDKNLLLVGLENTEKPGNLGAILRSSDATNTDAVIVCNETIDFFNPNVIRSSVGTVFTQKIIKTSQEKLIEFCQRNKVQILATYLRENTQNLYHCDLSTSTLFMFGTEASGLSGQWENLANKTIKIPMLGQIDSLNLSNSVAVCLYETIRQRLMR